MVVVPPPFQLALMAPEMIPLGAASEAVVAPADKDAVAVEEAESLFVSGGLGGVGLENASSRGGSINNAASPQPAERAKPATNKGSVALNLCTAS